MSIEIPGSYREPAKIPDAGEAKTRTPQTKIPDTGEAKTRRPPAKLPDAGAAKTGRAPAQLPKKDFQFEVSKDWNGRKINYEGENLYLNEAIDRLYTKVMVLDAELRPAPATDAEKNELKKQIKAMIVLVKSNPGLFNSIVNSDRDSQRLANLDKALNHKNLYPKQVTDALTLLRLERMPTSKQLLAIGYGYKQTATPEGYEQIKQAVQTILEYKEAQKKQEAT